MTRPRTTLTVDALTSYVAAAVALTIVDTGESPSVAWLAKLGPHLDERLRHVSQIAACEIDEAFALGAESERERAADRLFPIGAAPLDAITPALAAVRDAVARLEGRES